MNPARGTASAGIALPVSPARQNFSPHLSLAYDSGTGNGPFGIGWSIPLPDIRRKTDRGIPRYHELDGPDVFLFSGAEDLVPTLGQTPEGEWAEEQFESSDETGATFTVQRYRPRVEGNFIRIERWEAQADGEVYWRTVTPNNVTSVFGRRPESRISDPQNPTRVFQWMLEESFDDRGNVIQYVYKQENVEGIDRARLSERNRLDSSAAFANRYLKRVLYGNRTPFARTDWMFEVVLDYGEHAALEPSPDELAEWPVRADPFSSHRAGFEIRTYRLCRRVLLFHRFPELGDAPLLVRSVDMQYAENSRLTRLSTITQRGYLRRADGVLEDRSIPPLEFAYTEPVIDETIREVDPASLEGVPAGFAGPDHVWVDLEGEGVSGFLYRQRDAWSYKDNLGTGEPDLVAVFPPAPSQPSDDGPLRLAPQRLVATQPSSGHDAGEAGQLLDLAGDGALDLASMGTRSAGFFEYESGTWRSYHAFDSVPSVDWSDPNLRFLDVTGDGHADLLITEDEAFTFYPSRGEAGFAASVSERMRMDEDAGPRVLFQDAMAGVFLADMDGDGLTDLVRVRNGEICYWPNLGHGRFGAKVAMDNAPWFDHAELFRPDRIRFADSDGSGTSDLLYLGRASTHIWFNESGNAWSPPQRLDFFPPCDDASAVSVTDLDGRGTACLVWSSPLPSDAGRPIRYVDLMGTQKPHLLVESRNNMGAVRRLRYASSTRYYLADKTAGRPWITKLPFPVHVVERIETLDEVTHSRHVAQYAYHHGFFDGVEREFAGFGMVEQWDTQLFEQFQQDGLFPAVPPFDESLHQSPVYTRAWFHTGAYLSEQSISQHYVHEYYAGDGQAHQLPDTLLPEGLTAEEARQACRALRGTPLRQEVYAVDGSIVSQHPYAVSESNVALRRLQPSTDRADAVFLVHSRESLSYHYERNPADPRVSHSFTLRVDDFGNVTRSLVLVYPRREPAFPEQARRFATLQESDFINRPDSQGFYRLGIPFDLRTFEITGLPSPQAGLFTLDEIQELLQDAEAIPFEAMPDGAAVQNRLIHRSQALYLSNDLAGPLPAGQVESLALPFQSRVAVFTPGLLQQMYGPLVDETMLAEEGRYLFEDGLWWMPSARGVFDPQRFFVTTEIIDPFGHSAFIHYDDHALLVRETVDALGSRIQAALDYRALQPVLMIDPNGNRTAVRIDALGMTEALAMMGKPDRDEGDTLQDPTVRFEYDLFQWITLHRPVFAHSIMKERHGSGNTRFQESYEYTDGFGRLIMSKVQAEPGVAPQRGPDGELLLEDGHPVLADTSPAIRWVGRGRTVYSNKGNPVRQYEPYFSSTFVFEDEEELVEQGVSPVLHYDPMDRVIRVDHPDGTFLRQQFDPWQRTTFDANDTVLDSQWFADRQLLPAADSERRAADLAAAHANTPAVAHMDTLGRVVRSIADNGNGELFETRFVLDISGNPLQTIDARGNVAEGNVYDMQKRPIRTDSADAGTRRLLSNVAGNAIRAWDSRGHVFRTRYDALQRLTHGFVLRANGPEILLSRTFYGESHPDSHPGEEHVLNLRGRAFQVYDPSGLVTSEAFDFKGNLVRGSRRLALSYQDTPDWSSISEIEDALAASDVAAPLLQDEEFTEQREYDGLDRLIRSITPDGSTTIPGFNTAGFVDSVHVQVRGNDHATSFINNIDYNARGQRQRIRYSTRDGSDLTTTHEYDPHTFRLRRLRTVRHSDGRVLQDLRYTYDPVGNITEILDDAQQTVLFHNAVVRPDCRYEYDAVYRLVRAEGREHGGEGAGAQRDHADLPFMSLPHPNDANALSNYVEQYEYDAVGNIRRMIHIAQSGNWNRRYAYEDDTNRLVSSSLPGDSDDGPFSAQYEHDIHGNMTRMPHLAEMIWDQNDRLHEADLGGGGRAFYVYDVGGARVRKVVERPGGLMEERIYLGGVERFRRIQSGGIVQERETLHVADGANIIALVETETVHQGAELPQPQSRTRYQLANHLASMLLELDEDGQVITYEEYHPYGATAYRAGRSATEVGLKRYRYTGCEKDEETGLDHHGARYYASWLARWTAADPAGLKDGVNLYEYVNGNPVAMLDPLGTNGVNPGDYDMPTEVDIRRSLAEARAAYDRAEPDARGTIAEEIAVYESMLGGTPVRPQMGLLEEAHAGGPDPHPDRVRGTVSDEAIAITMAPWPTMERTGMHAGLVLATGATGGLVGSFVGGGFFVSGMVVGGSSGVVHGTGKAIIDQVEQHGHVVDYGAVGQEALSEGETGLIFGGLFGLAGKGFSRLGPGGRQSWSVAAESGGATASARPPKVVTSLPHETIPAPPRPTTTPANPRVPDPVGRAIQAGESPSAYGRYMEGEPLRLHMQRNHPNAEYQQLQRGPDVVPIGGLNQSIGEVKPVLREPGVAIRQINRWMLSKKWKTLDIQPGSTRFYLYDQKGRMWEGVRDVKANWRE